MAIDGYSMAIDGSGVASNPTLFSACCPRTVHKYRYITNARVHSAAAKPKSTLPPLSLLDHFSMACLRVHQLLGGHVLVIFNRTEEWENSASYGIVIILVFENTKLHGTKSKVQAVPLGFLVIPAPCENRVSKHLLGLRTMVSQQMEMQTTPKNTSYLRVFGDMGVPMCIHTSIPLYVYSIGCITNEVEIINNQQ